MSEWRVMARLFPSRYCEPMPDRFRPLADYNAERSRGLLHDDATERRMAGLQAEFNAWVEATI